MNAGIGPASIIAQARPVRVVEPGGLPGAIGRSGRPSNGFELHNPVANDLQRHIGDPRSFGAGGAIVRSAPSERSRRACGPPSSSSPKNAMRTRQISSKREWGMTNLLRSPLESEQS